MTNNNQPLTGKDLLKKLDEWGDKDKLELIKACGYDDYMAYYTAILDAKGLLPDEEPTGISSEHAEELSRRAREKEYEDDYQGAIEDYSKAIEIDPNYADAYASRGCLKMNSDDYQGAIEDYSKAIEINQNIALWVHNRASAKQELGLLQDALVDFNEEIKLSPDDPFAYRSRGDIKNSLGDYKGAIEDYEKAIEHDGFNVCTKKIRPKLEKLKSIYKKELERQGSLKQSNEPKTAAEYLDRGCDKDDQKDSKGAIEDYTKAIELNPNYAEAYANRGCAKEELGDKEGALTDWQKASDLGDEEAAQWIQEMKEKEPQKPIDNNVFTQLINYDLQKDYVDKLSKEEKLELFRGLTWEIEKIADKNWNSEENYTEEFMVNWITNSYAKEVLTPFENALDAEDEDDEYEPWDDHLLIFTFNEKFKDFDDYEVEAYEINEEDNQISFQCPSFWLDVPREFLISWALEFYEIEAKFVEDMTMYG